MTTKYGKEAIDYWAKKMAKHKAKITTIGAIIVIAIVYAKIISMAASG